MMNLKDFFTDDIGEYVIRRLSKEFPCCAEGDDIDILCRDREKVLAHILKVGEMYEKEGFKIKVKETYEYIHVDFYKPDSEKITLRFDLIDHFSYKKIYVNTCYADVVLDSKQKIVCGGIDVYVPSLVNDLAIRFLEYFEYPKKKWHFEYIEKHYHPDFITVVNEYTNLVLTIEEEKENRILTIKQKKKFYPLSKGCQVHDLSVIYETFFGQCTNGCFVEVGAFDGEYVSNTSGLADIGWEGYYIEPVPQYAEQCKKRHVKNKKVTVSQLAIGAEEGTVEINVGGPSSTICDKMTKVKGFVDWKKINKGGGKIEVKQHLLDCYLTEHKVKPGFELLSVDVDGYEWEVFRNFDIEKWRPQMVIVELLIENDKCSFLHENHKKVVRYFKEHKYRIVYKDFTNTIFVPAVESRLDYFLIWGHGTQYTREILDIIEKYEGIEILFIKKKTIVNMDKFVQDIYSTDTVPFVHLIDKSRYLLETPPEIFFILVKNTNVQERFFGHGDFRHIQCQLIKNIKTEIREKFDPKGTEHHVVHASDYESQVRRVLKVMGLPPLEYYIKQPNPDISIPFYLQSFDNYTIKNVGIDQLYVSLKGEEDFVPLNQSPHYKYLKGDKLPYKQYCEEDFKRNKITENRSSDVFDLMIKNFQYDYVNKRSPCINGKRSFIVARKIDDERYQIVDGDHRASILRHRGARILPVMVPLANIIGCLIYSKDRAMQLQATIESLFLHSSDDIDIVVLYKTSNSLHQKQYERLQKKFKNIDFQKEYDFEQQTADIMTKFKYILFLVDDNIFVNSFSFTEIIGSLKENKDAIGFSLRLGRNTTYCYPKSCAQKLPVFEDIGNGILKYDWMKAEYDFAYPMEISSSVYKVNTIVRLLGHLRYTDPNTFEDALVDRVLRFMIPQNKLLCYEKSVAFSNPINLVQTTVPDNRVGGKEECSATNLAQLFEEGCTIDIKKYAGLIPYSSHQEENLHCKKNINIRKFDVSKTFSNLSIKPKGVIHVGAHIGQEIEVYKKLSLEKILLIEANPEVFKKLEKNTKGDSAIAIADYAICDYDGEITLRVMSNDQSSSIFPLEYHKELYPDIVETKQITVKCRTLDTLLQELKLNPLDYDFLSIDVQGAELLVLQGAEKLLGGIKAIIVEVFMKELFKGGALIEEVDAFLAKCGFIRYVLFNSYDRSWGDALYIKDDDASN